MPRLLDWFEGLVDPYTEEDSKQAPMGLWQFCRHYTRGVEKLLVVMTALSAVTAVGEGLLYALLGKLVDWLASRNPQEFFSTEWPTLVGLSLFVLVFLPGIVFVGSLVMRQALMGNFPMLVRWQAHRYLLNQSYAFFQNEFSGRVATKLMQTSLAVRDSVMTLLDVMVFIVVYLITILLLVVAADWRLFLPILMWIILFAVCLKYFLPRLQHVSKRQADARALMTGRIVDSYANILTLKLFSHAERESVYAKEAMQEFMQTVHPQMRLVTWMEVCVWASNMLLVFSIGALGLWLWSQDSITPGAIAVAMAIAIRLSGMSHWVMWEVSRLFENIGIVQDGMSTLATPHTVLDDANAQALVVTKGKLEFDSLGFRYADGEKVFDGLNLQIEAGEKVGIVGRSGAGKSTLVNLLLRFYDVNEGCIRIDGQNIANTTQKSLRASIGMVSQDTSLLHRSVRENIMFGRPDAGEEEMLEAARKAQAHDFIELLRDKEGREGYAAHVGERGVTLSGGQRQRIAIARVLLKNAPILVLDEATAALDSEVEAAIQQCLNDLMAGKTVIAIAHRLSTIAAMDRLIVLDEGNIVEQGSHTELLRNEGLYHILWSHQSGGFLGEA